MQTNEHTPTLGYFVNIVLELFGGLLAGVGGITNVCNTLPGIAIGIKGLVSGLAPQLVTRAAADMGRISKKWQLILYCTTYMLIEKNIFSIRD